MESTFDSFTLLLERKGALTLHQTLYYRVWRKLWKQNWIGKKASTFLRCVPEYPFEDCFRQSTSSRMWSDPLHSLQGRLLDECRNSLGSRLWLLSITLSLLLYQSYQVLLTKKYLPCYEWNFWKFLLFSLNLNCFHHNDWEKIGAFLGFWIVSLHYLNFQSLELTLHDHVSGQARLDFMRLLSGMEASLAMVRSVELFPEIHFSVHRDHGRSLQDYFWTSLNYYHYKIITN